MNPSSDQGDVNITSGFGKIPAHRAVPRAVCLDHWPRFLSLDFVQKHILSGPIKKREEIQVQSILPTDSTDASDSTDSTGKTDSLELLIQLPVSFCDSTD